jgi:hypothetical protein
LRVLSNFFSNPTHTVFLLLDCLQFINVDLLDGCANEYSRAIYVKCGKAAKFNCR